MGKVFNQKVELASTKNTQKLVKYALAVPKKYSHIDFYPPKSVQENAKRSLQIRNEKPASQRGMTPVGIARARDLGNGRPMSPDTIKRMVAYFTRHEVDKQGETWSDFGKGRQAWLGWGGDDGYTWAKKILRQMEKADEENISLSENPIKYKGINKDRIVLGEASDSGDAKFIIGKPFKTLALGSVYSRTMSEDQNNLRGKQLSSEINLDLLKEIVRVYNKTKDKSPVIIDWNHNTTTSEAPPLSSLSLGEIIDIEVKEDGLYATPAYTELGYKVVKNSYGSLWSSPEFVIGKVYDRESGEKIGNAQILAITLTPRPAQLNSKIDRVTLMEKINMEYTMEQLLAMSPEELAKLCMEKHDMVKSLEAEKEGMKNELDMLKSEMDELAKEEQGEPSEAIESPEHIMEGEKTAVKMSEAQANLFSEIKAQNIKLSERIKALEVEKHNAERKLAVDSLLNTGKITPAEQSVAEKAYDLKGTDKTFWNMFSERKANSQVNYSEIGHSQKPSEVNLVDDIKALQKEKGISFSEALDLYKVTNSANYLKAFGG
jgi:hypothetical protein